MIKLVLIIFLIPPALYITWRICRDLHMLQLNSYRIGRYGRWVSKNLPQYFSPRNLAPVLAFPLIAFNLWAFAAAWSLAYLLLFFLRDRQEAKIALTFTSRARRLLAAIASIYALIAVITVGVYVVRGDAGDLYAGAGVLTASALLSFVPAILGAIITMPLEKGIENWYYRDARKKIRSFSNLTVIGITGSFGKTSTKFVLNELISPFFTTLMTPKSFNTRMGVTRVIRENLKPIHQVFITEMGARQPGDVKEICDLVHPKIGLLTAVGEQHLETFKSLDNIKKTKSELIESLPAEGTAVVNGDDANIDSLNFRNRPKMVRFGMDGTDLDYAARDIRITPQGTSFTVGTRRGEQASFQTKLLGRHNIYNILAAIAVACELGLDLKSLVTRVKMLRPAPHRLEIRKNPGDLTVIDNSFSSNPVGARMALEVLGQMAGKRRILITPGMVELGTKEYEYNRDFGAEAAAVCDFVILVGPKQAPAIGAGLVSAGYPEDKVFVAADLKEASARLKSMAQPGDVVLFENDLSDNYL